MAERKQNGGSEVNFTFTTSVHTYTVKFCSARVEIFTDWKKGALFRR
jgi:hypothetical protein